MKNGIWWLLGAIGLVAVASSGKSNKSEGLEGLNTAKTNAGKVRQRKAVFAKLDEAGAVTNPEKNKMKSKFTDIVRDGIDYNNKQIKKLQTEIEKFQKGKKGATQAQKDKIDEIIKWDRKLISDFRAEISSLKKRL